MVEVRKNVLKNICYIICFILFCFCGCNREAEESKNTPTPAQLLEITGTPIPTVTPEPTKTPRPTRKLTQSQQFELEEKQREEERLALLASPTPGPEPYVLLGTENEVEVGDIVTIGEYCHGQNPEYSYLQKFPVKWLVLDKMEDKALLISLYNLDAFHYIEDEKWFDYEDKNIPITWEVSYVRHWLNERWLRGIFNDTELLCILPTKVHTPDNPIYGTGGGADTTDFLFLLSIEEAQKYFFSDEARRTQIVPDVEIDQYDLMAYTHYLNTTDYYDWWLRSPGKTADFAAFVGRFGDVNVEGEILAAESVSIRPAMWVDLNKVKEVGLEMNIEK